MLGLLSVLAVTAGGCTQTAGYISAKGAEWGIPQVPAFDRKPPEVATRHGGPTNELLTGGTPPLLPDDAVDDVVGAGLKEWLTPIERRDIAAASQAAAVAETGTAVAWRTVDGAGKMTAEGVAAPISNAFRSVSGRICRDVRQYVEKGVEQRQRLVTLCREYHGDDLAIWVVGDATRAAEQ
ncbi:MAG TPA: hypothetical protein VET85_13100 [Stellaceae bacterium]|nr:hypothetical protein [Stellaceae bacterium]